jgi:hypothetical protein
VPILLASREGVQDDMTYIFNLVSGQGLSIIHVTWNKVADEPLTFRHLPRTKRRLCSHEARSSLSNVMRHAHVFASEFWNGCARLVCRKDLWHVVITVNQSLGASQRRETCPLALLAVSNEVYSLALTEVKLPKPFCWARSLLADAQEASISLWQGM